MTHERKLIYIVIFFQILIQLLFVAVSEALGIISHYRWASKPTVQVKFASSRGLQNSPLTY